VCLSQRSSRSSAHAWQQHLTAPVYGERA